MYFCRMDIRKAFDNALKRMKEKSWEEIYILVDIHDTILKACYYDSENYEYFPYAKECLQLMSNNQKLKLILWSSTYPDVLEKYRKFFASDGIIFDMVNINDRVENTELSCIVDKTYFNVGIDDKFGFEPETDWKLLFDFLMLKLC